MISDDEIRNADEQAKQYIEIARALRDAAVAEHRQLAQDEEVKANQLNKS